MVNTTENYKAIVYVHIVTSLLYSKKPEHKKLGQEKIDRIRKNYDYNEIIF